MNKIVEKLNGQYLELSANDTAITFCPFGIHIDNRKGKITGVTRFRDFCAREKFGLNAKSNGKILSIIGTNNDVLKIHGEYYYLINNFFEQREEVLKLAHDLFGENCIDCYML